MNSAIERLLALRVSDVMTKNVVAVSVNQTLDAAGRVFLEHSISGAPVVDERQHCTGVLTAVDFMKRRKLSESSGNINEGQQHGGTTVRELNDEYVGQRMSPAVHSIGPAESLIDAARLMCHHHVHRLIILDPHRRPAGVITSLDIVAAMVHAIEE